LPFASPAELRELVSLTDFDKSVEDVERDIRRSTAVLLHASIAQPETGVDTESWIASVAQPWQASVREVRQEFDGDVHSESAGKCGLRFANSKAAVNAALTLQHRTSDGETRRCRIAVHSGEILEFRGVSLSSALNISNAADLCAALNELSQPGQILLTRQPFDGSRQSVAEHPVAGCDPLIWHSHGRYLMRNAQTAGDSFEEAFEVFEVGCEVSQPADTERLWSSETEEQERMRGWRPSIGKPIPTQDSWIIKRKLGEGGFGEAWLAEQKETRRQQVFKFCFDTERLRSFRRELTVFRLLQKELGDRNDIARLEEAQTNTPPFYLKSEHVEAGNLEDWADAQGGLESIPLDERLRIVKEICVAVAAAHSKGVFHRDLKPANIFMRQDASGVWHPVLADFGIGALADSSLLKKHDITHGSLMQTMLIGSSRGSGTRMYKPPEADTGEHRGTTQADVYALGVMLFQMVTANFKRPAGIGWEQYLPDCTLSAATSETDNGPDQHVWTELLRDDIRSAIHVAPDLRLGSVDSLLERLKSLPERANAETAHRATARIQRRNQRLKRLLALTTASLLIVGGLSILSFAQWRQANLATAEKNDQLIETRRRLKQVEEIPLYAELVSQAFIDGNPSNAEELRQAIKRSRIHDTGFAAVAEANLLWVGRKEAEAIASLEKARLDLPQDDYVVFSLGNLYGASERYDEAATCHLQAAALRPDWMNYEISAARNLASSDQDESKTQAASIANRLAKQMGLSNIQIANIARTLILLDLEQNCLAVLARVEVNSPRTKVNDVPALLFEKAMALKELGRVAEARAAHERLIELAGGVGANYQAFGFFEVQEQNYEAAKKHLERALELNPRDIHSLRQLAGVYVQLKRPEDAFVTLKRLCELPSIRSTYDLSNLFALSKELERPLSDEAVEQINKLKDVDPTFHRECAEALRVIGQKSEAQLQIEHSIEMAADDPLAWFIKGKLLHFDFDDDEGAISAYFRTLELNPKFASAHNNLGLIYHVRGDRDNAIQEFKNAIDLNGENYIWHQNLADVYSDTEDWQNCIPGFERAIELNPHDERSFFRLSYALDELGRVDESEKLLRRILERRPDYATALNNLAMIRMKKQDYIEAEELLIRACKARPDHYLYWENLGDVHWDNDSHAKGIEAYIKATELDPKKGHSWKRLGQCHDFVGNADDARRCYLKAFEHLPEDSDLLRLVAIVLAEDGNFAGAQKLLDRALEMSPNDTDAMNNYAKLEEYRGDTEAAVGWLKKAFQGVPSGVLYIENIGAFRELLGARDFYIYTKRAAELGGGQDVRLREVRGAYACGLIETTRALCHGLATDFPDDPVVLNDIAFTLANGYDESLRDPKQALEWSIRSNELTKYSNLLYLDTLAASYASNGDFDAAVAFQRRVVNDDAFETVMTDNFGELGPNEAEAARQRLESYEMGEVLYDSQPEAFSLQEHLESARAWSFCAAQMPVNGANSPSSNNRGDYINRSLESLREAVTLGYADWDQIQDDPDLAVVRSSDAFKVWFENVSAMDSGTTRSISVE